MKVITTVDPFTYAVHGFKELVLKNTGLWAIAPDIAFLLGSPRWPWAPPRCCSAERCDSSFGWRDSGTV